MFLFLISKRAHKTIKQRTGFGIVQRVAKSSHSEVIPATNRERVVGVLTRDGERATGEQRRRGDALEMRRGSALIGVAFQQRLRIFRARNGSVHLHRCWCCYSCCTSLVASKKMAFNFGARDCAVNYSSSTKAFQSEAMRRGEIARVPAGLMFRVLNFWVLAFVVQNNDAAAAATLCILLHVTCFLLVLSLFILSLSSFSAIDDNSNNSMNLGV